MQPESGGLSASLVSGDARPVRHLLMLHGIYGRGRNWQGIARALVAVRPDYGCWLIDLPYHGDSGPGRHGDTIAGVATDLDEWAAGQGIQVDAVLGHSYGGKVALAFAARRPTSALQVWVIDSTPDTREPSGSAWDMLQIVRSLPPRLASRDEVMAAIVAGGFSNGVAQWMATNLVRDGDGFVWRLDFGVMERLIRDFSDTDLWSIVEDPEAASQLHFLKASESSVISADALQRLGRLPGDRVEVHHARGGHWIHAESPEVVTSLLSERLPR